MNLKSFFYIGVSTAIFLASACDDTGTRSSQGDTQSETDSHADSDNSEQGDGSEEAIDPCDGIPFHGECNGNTFRWCDYFDREIRSLNCNTGGLTCTAPETQSGESLAGGCYKEGCSQSDSVCSAQQIQSCDTENDQLYVRDCRQSGDNCVIQPSGGTTIEDIPVCAGDIWGCPTTMGRGTSICDNNVLLTCTSDGEATVEFCDRFGADMLCNVGQECCKNSEGECVQAL
jgi:hypothetical protein